ncbi:MAG: allantoinase AllB [Firmicutes bacterium]|nr:allantoinase AllB [Bacillota bacterium]
MMDTLIRGGTIVTPRTLFKADIGIRDGIVAKLLAPGQACSARQVIEADGLYVLPGLIDAHVHLREPGMTHKETIATGTQAAACGGVTTVLDMPNTLPPVVNAETVLDKGRLIGGRAQVDVGLYAALTPEACQELTEIIESGVMGFKLFLGPTTGGLRAPEWGQLLDVFDVLAAYDLPVVVHAEEREIIEHRTVRAKEAGDGYHHLLASRPEFGELSATAVICRLAGQTRAKVHIAHVSLAGAVEIIGEAKAAGWPVTAETCPPYLFLTEDDFSTIGTPMKILPPIRGQKDQDRLWQGLHAGVLDIIATDHAPHLPEEKATDIWNAPSGAPGVETLLPLMLEAVHRGKCTLSDIVRWCCARPAAIFGLHGKGHLRPGAWADIVIVDPEKTWHIQNERLHNLARSSPFVNWRGRGMPVVTLLRGQIVARDGEPMGEPTGRWLRSDRGHHH